MKIDRNKIKEFPCLIVGITNEEQVEALYNEFTPAIVKDKDTIIISSINNMKVNFWHNNCTLRVFAVKM